MVDKRQAKRKFARQRFFCYYSGLFNERKPMLNGELEKLLDRAFAFGYKCGAVNTANNFYSSDQRDQKNSEIEDEYDEMVNKALSANKGVK